MNNSQVIAGDIECSNINPTLSAAFNKAVFNNTYELLGESKICTSFHNL